MARVHEIWAVAGRSEGQPVFIRVHSCHELSTIFFQVFDLPLVLCNLFLDLTVIAFAHPAWRCRGPAAGCSAAGMRVGGVDAPLSQRRLQQAVPMG